MFFQDVKQGPPDPMYHLKVAADQDTNINKVDLGVGVYRNEKGQYHELGVLKAYEITTGSPEFLQKASQVIFGKDSEFLNNGQIASVQTISGTGAIHIGALFLRNSVPNLNKSIYVGTPTWGNYVPMFNLLGLEVQTYNYYDKETGEVEFASLLAAVRTAPKGSTFVLQACCNNPTASELTEQQWRTLAEEMTSRGHLPFFDIAYQGLGRGLDEDAYGVRHFASLGSEMIVAQSFAKNLGLYGERVGALHVVASTKEAAAAVKDQLRCMIRWEFSSSPAYGSRLVDLILSDPESQAKWHVELREIRERLERNRQKLFHQLANVHKHEQTPGNWHIIKRGQGLFSLLPLTPTQCEALKRDYHIYVAPNGRMNISGLRESNINYVAQSIDTVVRSSS
ncbi:unnamed protein product [Clonostachys byssicola]|uniref:Aspartate aminotransferase n=1 Tax=Clonostachys byssicola TaxID=160290 RepID=A0A9N9Y901_9HYPO|nr:unnamed protein product [Clonostachys byssicola]